MNFIKNFLGYYKFSNKSKEWKKVTLCGVTVNIQPGFDSNNYLEKNLEMIIKKISELGKKYYLVYNSVDLFDRIQNTDIKFRLSDVEGNGENQYNTLMTPIPDDIKRNIVNDVRNKFKGYSRLMDVDEFPDRGYIIFQFPIQLS